LSDSAGNFTNPKTLGSFPSSETFDPAIGAMPGNVSGLIPVVPEGCNYYARVVSTSPSVIGTVYGPFCIKHCDITTNQTIDIHLCIHETVGASDTVEIDINRWNTTAEYPAGNRFIVQLLDMMTLAVVNEGALGIVFDTTSTSFILTVPGLNDLLSLGIMPGAYYMRIIADNSTTPWNSNGTIIRLTIGAPADNLSIVPGQTFYCNTEIAALYIVPYNPDSEYEWLSTALNNGVPFKWPYNPLLVNFDGADPGPYSFRVREYNFGCVGEYSPLATIYIITIPDVNIAGPTTVCQGDTFLYNVTFLPETYYEWTLEWGTIVDTSNNEIIVTFDSAGTTRLSLHALNNCGERASTYTVNVVQTLSVNAGDDATICAGDSIRLVAKEAGFKEMLTTTLSGTSGNNGNMFDLRAAYELTVTSFDAYFTSADTVDVEIYYRPASYVGSETDPSSWTRLGAANGIITNTGTATPVPLAINITIPAGSTYGFYITTTDGSNMAGSTGTSVGNVYASDGILSFLEGAAVDFAFSAPASPRVWNGTIHYFTEEGVSFLWSNGATTKENTVKPSTDTNYIIEVADTNNCNARDDVNVFVNPLPVVNAGRNDTLLCKGESLQFSATGAHIYRWSPAEGLSDASIANPTVLTLQTTPYVLQGIDTLTGCVNYDTVRLTIEGCDVFIKIPQAFSPNDDGHNDFFSVFGENFDTYEIRIFNRWGEQVYYSANVSELCQGYPCNQGWNGTHKGKKQDTGVYVYYIKAGKGSDSPLERKGNVTLVR
ncbi:MAG TPA: gliding motility-associated C-terminal domain-containing protein, partial [Chitinophagales bacterium]|nr:gliding motility-associated C-terminal domain-containing protein [Chitinophagales bacterium]